MYKAMVIGLGRIGWEFDNDPKRDYIATHAAGYEKNPNFKLVAACDSDTEKRTAFGKKYGGVSLYGDYQEALLKEKPDAVSICTTSASHFTVLKKCLEANVPAVFCEKPVVVAVEEGKIIREIARTSKSKILVNHSRRWDELHRDAAKMIFGGGLGELQSYQAFYTAGIFTTGTHLVDMLLWFFGRPETVIARVAREKPEPELNATFNYPNGVTGGLFSLDVKQYLIFEIDAYFTEGRIRIKESGKQLHIWRPVDSPNWSGYKELGENRVHDKPGYVDVMANAIRNVHGVLEGKETPYCGLEDGVVVIDWIEKCCESALQKKEIRLS